MKKYFLMVVLAICCFGAFARSEHKHSEYGDCICSKAEVFFDGQVVYEIDNYKDMFVVYSQTIKAVGKERLYSNFVYFFKKVDDELVLDGYISVNNATQDILESTKDMLERSFYDMGIKSFEEYIIQEMGEVRESTSPSVGKYSKTAWEVRRDAYHNVYYLWW